MTKLIGCALPLKLIGLIANQILLGVPGLARKAKATKLPDLMPDLEVIE